ncbi:MAG TPA: alpha/beta hydrolase [Stellaceae bacterium]|nr:alpha/beta hydrolase [Stellaceae bacterium]
MKPLLPPALGRRAVLLGAAAGALASRTALAATPNAAAPGTASPNAPSSNAKVFLDYTQAQLDNAYTQTVWAPNAGQLIAGYAKDSAAVRKRMPPVTQAYGKGKAEQLDIFAPKGADRRPVMIFLHGGAWHGLSKDDASAPAPTFVDAGMLYVAVNFDNIPATTLPGMADQVCRAVSWIATNIGRFGGDPNRIFISGHSSGGHLAAVVMTTDWKARNLPAPSIKGALLLSGMYELYPVLLSVRANYVHVTPAEVAALSPLRHMDRVQCPAIVANGDKESPEFKRQNEVFAEVMAGMGLLHHRFMMPGINHFELANELNNADSPISRLTLDMMKRA